MLILKIISDFERGLFHGRCGMIVMINPCSIPTNPEYMEAWIRVGLQCPWLVVKKAANKPEAPCHCRRGITKILHCSYAEHMRFAALKVFM